MLKRTARLRSAEDYALAYRKGRRVRALGFTCLIVPGQGDFRVGVVASKKVSPKATVRNRYRRWVYAALRENKAKLPARGYHLVFTVSPNIKPLTYRDVCISVGRIVTGLAA
jgi:ribonuclease P protein component